MELVLHTTKRWTKVQMFNPSCHITGYSDSSNISLGCHIQFKRKRRPNKICIFFKDLLPCRTRRPCIEWR